MTAVESKERDTELRRVLIYYSPSSAAVREPVRQHPVLQVRSDDGAEAAEGLPGCWEESPEYQKQPDDSGNFTCVVDRGQA